MSDEDEPRWILPEGYEILCGVRDVPTGGLIGFTLARVIDGELTDLSGCLTPKAGALPGERAMASTMKE